VEIDGATVTKAPTSVIWTADTAHQIGQNEFQTFTLSVGRLPAAGTTVTLPAAQGYPDGTTVNSADTEEDGHDHAAASSSAAASAPATAEKEHHPAPAFVTTAAEATGSATATPDAAPAASTAPAGSSSGSETAVWLGLVAGVLGLAAGVTALVRTRARKN
jgi:hypothetical protein